MSRKVSIGVGVFLLLGSIGGVMNFFSNGFSIPDLVSAIIMGFLGYWFFIVKGINKPKASKAVPVEKTNKAGKFEVDVVGASYDNDDGTSRQDIIREYVKDYIEQGIEEAYNGMNNEQILKSGRKRIYEITVSDLNDVELVPEPKNKYDSNAIRVDLNGFTIGYIPKEDTERVSAIIKKNVFPIEIVILGGRYKEVVGNSIKTVEGGYKARLVMNE